MKPDVWIDGVFVPWDEARIHPLCHSNQRGATLFESIDCAKAVNGKAAIFRLRDHMLRFQHSAEVVGMPLPYSVDELVTAAVDTVRRSGLLRCTIRPLALYADPVFDIFPGDARVSVIIGIGEKSSHKDTITMKTSRFRKIDSISMPITAKVSGNYIASMIAKSEALREGFDDTVMLDTEGMVAEGATSNIFMVEKGGLITSPGDHILPGITRSTLMALTTSLGIRLTEDRIPPERMVSADEVFISSSGLGVMPVVRVDDRIIGSGQPGALTIRLHDYYQALTTGQNPEFERWLTYL